MMSRWLPVFCVLFLCGCASEKRLGESFIESRRYSRGWHVNVQHNAPRPVTDFEKAEVAEALATQPVTTAEVAPPTQVKWTAPPMEQEARSSREAEVAFPLKRRHITLPSAVTSPSVLRTTEVLPEPIEGRHPASVPGFLLALGWCFGLIGEAAVSYLGMPISGVPFLAGLLASIAGYFVSRRAYRASLEHPELYPRYRLSKAGRIVSFAPLAPVVVYIGIVLILVLLLGGL